MSAFSAEWLALREPADWRSRSSRVTEAVVSALPTPVRAVDLGAGTGSNVRFLSRTVTSPVEWLLVDGDHQLLLQAQRLMGLAIDIRVADLSSVSELQELTVSRNLVTASALLDLVSDIWLEALCGTCRMRTAVVLFALTYDGRIACTPAEPEDDMIRRLVNDHQHSDKGFLGPALGPDASSRAAEYLAEAGYAVVRDRSDWILEQSEGALQTELIKGWAAAARENQPRESALIDAWEQRRLAHIRVGHSRLVVGHEDLGAFIA